LKKECEYLKSQLDEEIHRSNAERVARREATRQLYLNMPGKAPVARRQKVRQDVESRPSEDSYQPDDDSDNYEEEDNEDDDRVSNLLPQIWSNAVSSRIVAASHDLSCWSEIPRCSVCQLPEAE
jgi:DNA-dependent RNA polymerase auxiliary subunit epsilon